MMKTPDLGMVAAVALLCVVGCAGTPERGMSMGAEGPPGGPGFAPSVPLADSALVEELHRPVPMNRDAFRKETMMEESMHPVVTTETQEPSWSLGSWLRSQVDICQGCNCCILDETTDGWRFETSDGGHAFRPALKIGRHGGAFEFHLLRFKDTRQASRR